MLITERKLRTIIRSLLRESSMSDNKKVSEEKNIIYVPQGNWNSIIKIMKRDFPNIESFQNLTASKLAAAYNNKNLKVGEALDVPQLIKKLKGELDGMPKIYSTKELKSSNIMNSIFDHDTMGFDKAVENMTVDKIKKIPGENYFEKYCNLLEKMYINTNSQKEKEEISDEIRSTVEKYSLQNENDPELLKLINDVLYFGFKNQSKFTKNNETNIDVEELKKLLPNISNKKNSKKMNLKKVNFSLDGD